MSTNFLEGKILCNFYPVEVGTDGQPTIIPGSEPMTVIAEGSAGETWQEDYGVDIATGDRYFWREHQLGVTACVAA